MALLNIFKKKDDVSAPQNQHAVPVQHTEREEGVNEKNTTAHAVRVGSLLLRPLVTEKGTRQNTQNQYAFVVAPSTNKIEVKQAVEAVYNIRPVKVNMVRVRGKKIRYGRTAGVTKAWKKAIVTLPKGKTIQLYEGV